MEVIKGKQTGTKVNCPHCGNEIIIRNTNGKKKKNNNPQSKKWKKKDWEKFFWFVIVGLAIYFVFIYKG